MEPCTSWWTVGDGGSDVGIPKVLLGNAVMFNVDNKLMVFHNMC